MTFSEKQIEQGGTFAREPRQVNAWKNYINPKSKTYANAYRSALAAGYTKKSASVVTGMAWWKLNKELYRKRGMITKAEKVLKNYLEIDDEKNPQIMKIKQDTAKYTLTALSKDYSNHKEKDTTSTTNNITINFINPLDETIEHPSHKIQGHIIEEESSEPID